MNGLILPHNGIYTPPEALLIGGVMRGTAYSRRAVISGGGGDIWDDVPGMCFLLEASKSASYSGSGQTWSNLVPTPADGSAQTDYDFYRGDTSSATTDDPTFNGTAGVAGAYWSYDGGDFHRIITGTVPTFLKSAHKTSAANTSWLAWCGRVANNAAGQMLGLSSANGIELLTTNSGGNNNYTFASRHPSYNAWFAQSGAKTAGTDFLLICAYKRNGSSNEVKMWYNTRTAATPTVTTGGTTTNDGSGRCGVGTRPDGSIKIANGSRCYGISGGSDDMNDTLAGYIFDYFNTSTGITFA